jgi:type I restriction enzyme S subunit
VKLPESWMQMRIGDVLNRVEKKVNPQESETTHFYVGLEHIQSYTGLLLRNADEVTESSDILSIKTVFQKGDILYGKLRPNLNKVYLSERDGICSTDIWVLRASSEVIPEFALYYLRSPAIHLRASQLAVGANLPRVPAESFDRILFPLPTLSEQQRIVVILQQLEAIGNERTRTLKSVSSITREHFIAMFGHPAENPHGFKVEKFSKLGTLDRGISKHRPRDAAHLYNGPYPFIQTGDVSNAGDWITEYKSTYSEAGLAQSRLWPAGTLCITIAANIARVAILDFDACFPDSVVGFLSKEGVTNEYILYCLRFYQEYFEFRAPKSAQMNINLEILRQLKIPNPPEHLQKEFSEVVRSVRNLEESIGGQLNKHHELLNEIFIAAFSGELTETWRNKNQTQIQAEAEARAERLALTAKPQTPVKPPTAAKKSSPAQSRPARLALFGELSEFQRFVFDALHEWPAGILIPDDSAAFEDFCRQWPVEHERNTQDRARRALDQLAALGLIAKVSLPNPQGQYLTAYRMLREGDERRTGDIAAIGRSREMA